MPDHPWIFSDHLWYDFREVRDVVKFMQNAHTLRELGSYILRDTSKPWQLKVPGPKPTIEQLKEAHKGNGYPRKGNQWPPKGNGPPFPWQEPRALLIAENAFNVPLTALIVVSRAELLNKAKI